MLFPSFLNSDYQKDDHPRDLCKKFNFIYEVCAHDNFSEIKSYTTGVNSNIAIISGARIIQKNVIDLFRYGIINYQGRILCCD